MKLLVNGQAFTFDIQVHNFISDFISQLVNAQYGTDAYIKHQG